MLSLTALTWQSGMKTTFFDQIYNKQIYTALYHYENFDIYDGKRRRPDRVKKPLDKVIDF